MHRISRCLSSLFLTSALVAPVAIRAEAQREEDNIKTKDVEKTKSTTSGTTTGTTVIGMSGTTAKTALTDSTGRKGTKIIVTSLSSAARSSANTGSGATVIQIPTGISQPSALPLGRSNQPVGAFQFLNTTAALE